MWVDSSSDCGYTDKQTEAAWSVGYDEIGKILEIQSEKFCRGK